MQLNPRENFVIARGLEDPSDSTTYYLQAVIRNALTDAIIDTVNLTDNGNRRFTKSWQAPADVSGNGLYILVTISVYTDAGYSVRSGNYGDSFTEYLVQNRLTIATVGGGSGGDSPDIDYKKIQTMINSAVAGIKIPQPTPQVDLTDVKTALVALLSAVSSIRMPDNSKQIIDRVVSNLTAIHKSLSEAITAQPKFEKTDLLSVLSQLASQKTTLDSHTKMMQTLDVQELQTQVNQLFDRIKEFFTGDVNDIKAAIADLKASYDNIAYTTLKGQMGNNQPNKQ